MAAALLSLAVSDIIIFHFYPMDLECSQTSKARLTEIYGECHVDAVDTACLRTASMSHTHAGQEDEPHSELVIVFHHNYAMHMGDISLGYAHPASRHDSMQRRSTTASDPITMQHGSTGHL